MLIFNPLLSVLNITYAGFICMLYPHNSQDLSAHSRPLWKLHCQHKLDQAEVYFTTASKELNVGRLKNTPAYFNPLHPYTEMLMLMWLAQTGWALFCNQCAMPSKSIQTQIDRETTEAPKFQKMIHLVHTRWFGWNFWNSVENCYYMDCLDCVLRCYPASIYEFNNKLEIYFDSPMEDAWYTQ